MNANHKLLETLTKLGKQDKTIERLYARMLDEELFVTVYKDLFSSKGASAPSKGKQALPTSANLKGLRRIIASLKENQWQWESQKRSHTSGVDESTPSRRIPIWGARLLQTVLRRVLEAYYEPIFLDENHGYRKGYSCHTALAQVKARWTGVVWFVSGQIEGCFDTVSNEKLLAAMTVRIKDFRFIKLLRNLLKASIWDKREERMPLSGTPLASVLKPLLLNIALHELDEYVVNDLKPLFDCGKRRRGNSKYDLYRHHIRRGKAQNDQAKVKHYLRLRQRVPRSDGFDPNFRRLLYVRYADTFLIGVIGSKDDAKAFKTKVEDKLADMELILSGGGAKITHAATGTRFLGYDIYVRNRLDNRRLNGTVQLSVPPDVVNKLKRRYGTHGRGACRPYLQQGSDEEIIRQYDLELRGYYNYYKLAYNVSNRIGSVKSVMWWSLMHTLASKHKTRIVGQVKKLKMIGPKSGLSVIGVSVESARGRKRLVTFGDFNMKWTKVAAANPERDAYQRGLRFRDLTHNLKHDICELCGAVGPTQVHHIRRMADVRAQRRNGNLLRWQAVMAERNRRSLIVCKPCHLGIHRSDS